MAYTITEGKFPKKPNYGNYLEACRKDFRNFKDINDNKLDDILYSRIVPSTQVVIDHKMIFNQQENIENLFILPYQEIFFTFS